MFLYYICIHPLLIVESTLNKLYAVLICLVANCGLFSQNLVPNPSFEVDTACPYSAGEIYYAVPWNLVNGRTTDYFNACSGDFGVPVSLYGTQYARTGVAFSGIGVKDNSANYREYLQVPLTDSLIADSCYYVEFYCNLVGTSYFGSANYSLAIDRIGLLFSDSAVTNAGPGDVLQYSPQVSSSTFLTDTISWMKVSGYYNASGGEKYVTIGNFYDDLSTNTLPVTPSSYGSYYMIDDVTVQKVAGCDTTLSIDKSITDIFVKLYPNPGNGMMMLESNLTAEEAGMLFIHDMIGRLVHRQYIASGSQSMPVDLKLLETGTYIYEFVVNDQPVKRDKVSIVN